MSPPRVLIWNGEGQWPIEVGAPLPSGWQQARVGDLRGAASAELIIASPGVAVEALRGLRADRPEVGVLMVVDRHDPRLEVFLGDQGVYFAAHPIVLDQLRTCVREVLSYREESQRLRQDGGALPTLSEAEPVEGWYELTGPTHPVFLRRFRTWIASLDGLALGESELRRLVHAVREIGWNAIEWGNRFDLRRKLELACLILDDRLVFRIQDEGGAVDWSQELPEADAVAEQQRRHSEGRRYGGLGLQLVKRIMDRIEISSNGNIVVMEKYLKRQDPRAGDSSPAGPDEGRRAESGR